MFYYVQWKQGFGCCLAESFLNIGPKILLILWLNEKMNWISQITVCYFDWILCRLKKIWKCFGQYLAFGFLTFSAYETPKNVHMSFLIVIETFCSVCKKWIFGACIRLFVSLTIKKIFKNLENIFKKLIMLPKFTILPHVSFFC